MTPTLNVNPFWTTAVVTSRTDMATKKMTVIRVTMAIHKVR